MRSCELLTVCSRPAVATAGGYSPNLLEVGGEDTAMLNALANMFKSTPGVIVPPLGLLLLRSVGKSQISGLERLLRNLDGFSVGGAGRELGSTVWAGGDDSCRDESVLREVCEPQDRAGDPEGARGAKDCSYGWRVSRWCLSVDVDKLSRLSVDSVTRLCARRY